MMRHKFLEIQTVSSEKTYFLRTVRGAILGLIRLNFLSVAVTVAGRLWLNHESVRIGMVGLRTSAAAPLRWMLLDCIAGDFTGAGKMLTGETAI